MSLSREHPEPLLQWIRRNIIVSDKDDFNVLSERSVKRLEVLSIILAGCFGIFGFVSFDYINNFKAEVTLFANIWPRILFNSLPFIGLYLICKSKLISNYWKFIIWSMSFALITTIAASIHVWGIVLEGKDIILYVHAANNVLMVIISAVIAPPITLLVILLAAYTLLFILPLLFVCFQNGNELILKLVINDSGFYLLVSASLAIFIHNVHYSLHRNSSKYVKKRIADRLHLSSRFGAGRDVEKGFVLSFDLRGFTKILKKLENLEAKTLLSHPVIIFYTDFRSAMSNLMERCGGVLHKTTGDGAIGLWGILDRIPTLEGIEDNSTFLKLHFSLFEDALEFSDGLIEAAINLTRQHNLELTIGIGIDYGICLVEEYGTFQKELDIVGIPIVMSVRLEEFTKYLMNSCGRGHYLVVSPNCEKFISAKHELKTFLTGEKTSFVRSFKEVSKIFYKRYPLSAEQSLEFDLSS